MIVTARDLEDSLARVRAGADPRAGIYGPGSTAWRLQEDAIIFLGGGRATLLQLAHPFVAYAIDQHSRTRADVAGRFRRTFAHVFAMSFGDLDAAFAAARRVHAIHARIHGTLPVAVGPYPAGTPYDANDVDALRWVWATLVHTVVSVHELVLGRLPGDVKDAYVRDARQFARLFAIPEERLPAGWAALDRYVAEMCASPALTVSEPAREMSRFLFGDGETALGRWVARLTTGLVPDRLRRQYGLSWGLGDRTAFAASLAAVTAAWRVLPRRARRLPAAIDADRRMAGKGPSAVARWLDGRFDQLAALTAGRPG